MERLEYIDGEVVATDGASYQHSLITANCSARLAID
jgi:hypothetical protein